MRAPYFLIYLKIQITITTIIDSMNFIASRLNWKKR